MNEPKLSERGTPSQRNIALSSSLSSSRVAHVLLVPSALFVVSTTVVITVIVVITVALVCQPTPYRLVAARKLGAHAADGVGWQVGWQAMDADQCAFAAGGACRNVLERQTKITVRLRLAIRARP
jgi:hypothetical protein